jgi:hypothetical protein
LNFPPPLLLVFDVVLPQAATAVAAIMATANRTVFFICSSPSSDPQPMEHCKACAGTSAHFSNDA